MECGSKSFSIDVWYRGRIVVTEQRTLDLILIVGQVSSVVEEVEVGEVEDDAEDDDVAVVSRSIALSISPHNLSEF